MTAAPLRTSLSDARYDAVAQASAAAVIRGYSTSFGWACRLLGRPVRGHVRNIYALVRLADEIVDGPVSADDPGRGRVLLDELERETADAVITGYSTNLVVHAYALTARRFALRPDLMTAFFASMRMDLSTSVHTPASLATYIYGSAEVVGLACLQVFLGADGREDYDKLAPGARRLGAAFQKINFLRDLATDHIALGRSYFPGIDSARLTDGERDLLVDDIRVDLVAAGDALALLPTNSRTAVAAAHGLFAELTARIAATPAEELVRTRVRVPGPVKARILARALATGGRP
ncbi:Phytoene/squalene synthetase [Sanguibacter gelidistatuariae]|uniref:Phytoene/squalene synthetase n=1 Tax=Sanguibacter gelidistatuariae TaxID=1814289 RepID=A0A1G6RTK4_9MICO|nr:squalene/phytoene synthase family protein [Sanguibacter gelidistatuariae]SDD07962.1 Phytoene/squalene synthetase [Sanguibacter gelidistatuariae]